MQDISICRGSNISLPAGKSPHYKSEFAREKAQAGKSNKKFILTSYELSINVVYIQIVILRKEKDYGGKEKQY